MENESSNDFSSLLIAKNIIKKEEPKVILTYRQKFVRFFREIFNWGIIYKIVKIIGHSGFLFLIFIIIPLQTKFNRNYKDFLNTRNINRRLPEITIITQ